METVVCEGLNQRFGVPGGITFTVGRGGFPEVTLVTEWGRAIASLYGGQVLSYVPQGTTTDVLFLSPQARYQPGTAIRGGVPICWPWFGPDPTGAGRPNHGFARDRPWQVCETRQQPDGSLQITLTLSPSPETLALEGAGLSATLDLILGPSLTLVLTTHNPSDRPVSLSQALHTYLQVGDIAQVQVLGLEGVPYIDKLDNTPGKKLQGGALAISAPVDRIYGPVLNPLTLVDQGLGRTLEITSHGSASAVVWNPWAEGTQRLGDLPPDAYTQFLCVETTNAGEDSRTLPPQGNHCLQVSYHLTPLGH